MIERDIDEDYIRAVLSHGWGMRNNIEPILPMEKVLYAIDEVTGLINATILMRPSKSVLDLEVSSVRKKFKDPKFAAGVSRDVVKKGAEIMGVTVDDLFAECITALQSNPEEVGMKGNL